MTMRTESQEAGERLSLGEGDPILAACLEEVTRKLQAGEAVDLESLAREHPDQADRLERLWPAIRMMAAMGHSGETALNSQDQPRIRLHTIGLPGQGRLGDFRIVREVARGGMGVVYEAEQLSLHRRVALKILPLAAALDARHLQRFQVETQAAALLEHPGIVPIHSVGSEHGVHYYAMQFIDGITLAALIGELRQREGWEPTDHDGTVLAASVPTTAPGAIEVVEEEKGPQPIAKRPAASSWVGTSIRTREHILAVARLGQDAAEALDHAHDRGIVHRDIKPGNLMLDVSGKLWITDFGLAQVQGGSNLTFSGDLVGTLRYMSPEQAAGRRVVIDGRTDIYSLGATLYELLTLRPAVDGKDRAEILGKITGDEPVPLRTLNPSVPLDLETIVQKAMAKEPADRYATARELADDLRRFRENLPIRARRPTLLDRAFKWSLRHKPQVLTAAASLTLLLIAATVASSLVASKERERGEAALAVRDREVALRQQAEDFAEQSRRRQVQLSIENGTRMMDQGDLAGSLPWFVEALRLDEKDPSRAEVHRIRLAAILARCVKPSRIWFGDQRVLVGEFSPNGRAVVIVTADGVARVYEVASGNALGPALRHQFGLTHASFSPDGARLVTSGDDHTARVWDIMSGREAFPPMKHEGKVRFAFFSPDGTRIVTHELIPPDLVPTMCRLWDATSGLPITAPFRAGHPAFSPDGRLLATGEAVPVRLHDARTGEPVKPPLALDVSIEGWSIHPRSFSPDSRRLVTFRSTGGAHLVRIWDTLTGEHALPPLQLTTQPTFASFSPDGRWVVISSSDGMVQLMDPVTGRTRGLSLMQSGACRQVRFSPDGSRLIANYGDCSLRIIDLASGQSTFPPIRHRELLGYTSGTFSSDGRQVLSVGDDSTARLWDLATGLPRRLWLPHGGGAYCGTFSPDGRMLATAGERGVHFRDAATGALLGPPLADPGLLVGRIRFSQDGRLIMAMPDEIGADRIDALVWDFASRKPIAGSLRHQLAGQTTRTPVTIGVWSSDGRRIATAARRDGATGAAQYQFRVWDSQTGAPVTPALFSEAPINGLDFSPDGKILAVASGFPWHSGQRGTAFLLNTETGLPMFQTLRIPSICRTVRFSPDGRRLATASGDDSGMDCEARVWDSLTGQPLTPALRHTEGVSFVMFSPDGGSLMTAGGDRTVRLWNAASGLQLVPPMRHEYPVQSADFSPDGRFILSVSSLSVMLAENRAYAQIWEAATGHPVTPRLWHTRAITSAEFAPDSRRFVTTSYGDEAQLWELTRDTRRLEDFQGLAHLLSGTKIDATGAQVPLETSELREAFENLQHRDPGLFTASPEQVLSSHYQQALACEAAGNWAAARGHLDALIAAGRGARSLRVRRAQVHAELEHWREAAEDYRGSGITSSSSFYDWYSLALLELVSTNQDGYRYSCSSMLSRFGIAEALGEPATFTAWACALRPGALDDYGPALALAERLRTAQPKNQMAAMSLGALLFRAGKFEEAASRLEEASRLGADPRSSPIYAWLFLAMAHHRLGHADEARTWRDKAVAAADQVLADHAKGSDTTVPWRRRLALKLLSDEVKSLVPTSPVESESKSSGPR